MVPTPSNYKNKVTLAVAYVSEPALFHEEIKHTSTYSGPCSKL